MKRKNKVVLSIVAILGLFAVVAIWLFDAAVEVAGDTVDTTLSAARSVEKIARDEPASTEKTATRPDQDRTAERQPDKERENQAITQIPAPGATVPAPSAAKESGNKTDKSTEIASRNGGKTNEPADTDVLTAIERNVGPLLGDDADDVASVTALTKALRDDSSDDDWMALVPGGKSPTLKKLMAGKYAGKEDQAVEDAISDPQAWRLFSFLGGL